jgi:hypothetical protein
MGVRRIIANFVKFAMMERRDCPRSQWLRIRQKPRPQASGAVGDRNDAPYFRPALTGGEGVL